ncbi:hypothetical protein GCM10009592_32130 [Brachybacterium rhamnosum]|uniref:Uncharacterized protein n=1 Tax=Brachybacterium rhamnosum TaxID=173361 RepID=A0ABW4Q4M5_9MICO
MTTTAPRTARHESPSLRALRLDLVLQRPVLWFGGALALVVLLLALGGIAFVGVVPILMAVGVPVAFGAREPLREAALRGSLGIGRAAHARARTGLVLALQLLLLALAAIVILLHAHHAPYDDAIVTRPLGPDAVMWAGAVLWSHIWVGRDALHHSSTVLWARASISYACFYVAAMVGMGIPVVVAGLLGAGVFAVPIGTAIGAVVVLGGALAVLRWRSRVWARTA